MILILVLGVLGLMAVIGVTFATFTGQSRVAARGFAQSKIAPQPEELMDFALSQLISDTNDVRSAIRGHSLARDMYGNDGTLNGFVEYRSDGAQMAPGGDPYFYVTSAAVAAAGVPLYDLETNIPAGDPLFYGFNFNRWTIKIAFQGPFTAGQRVISQSLEVVGDSGFVPGGGGNRVLTVVMRPEEVNARIVNPTYPGGLVTVTPAFKIQEFATAGTAFQDSFRFTLDGRWLHAFNGPGQADQAKYGNFRFNTYSPAGRGMDEDYDAVDLENWFLAMQSADGQVIIPSFHRPAAVRYDPLNTDPNAINDVNDWSNTVDLGLDADALRKKLSRILRPRRADDNDPQTFPDLVPDEATGRIDYDVDNDGDGIADSVWVDLGYPARRNAKGNLYKPLFAFMVIGLNGRMPLNTSGNMAARGGVTGDDPQSGHAAHLGNSVSEIDPSYGLQNFYDAALTYTQVDNAGVDVRLTQLRNILAGTRPHADPYNPDMTGLVNGDLNWVGMGMSGSVQRRYYLPNGKVDAFDVAEDGSAASAAPPSGYVRRANPAVPGRWGEPDSVAGGAYVAGNAFASLNSTNPSGTEFVYANEVRPGYSISYTDLALAGVSRPLDSADDNYNSFDMYPVPDAVSGARLGEIGDEDYYDFSGSLAFAIERIRRFVTPIDVNGSGRVARFNGRGSSERGADPWGRVEYRGYFRPPGLPGQIDPATGQVTYAPFVAGNAYPNERVTQARVAAGTAHNNNILHGFESHLVPNTRGTPQRSGGILAYEDTTVADPTTWAPGRPRFLPTYDGNINTGRNLAFNAPPESGGTDVPVTIRSRSDGLNEADEVNLYEPNPQVDAIYGYADLEWLYRSHDVDGASLSSRLSQLAPISFANGEDELRRRRLYSIDTWESNLFAWANDNPLNAFGAFTHPVTNVDYAGNSRFAPTANAGMGATTYTPGLAQRGRKINLNMPLPVSIDPREPIRQKWISDAYQLMKTVLPPRAVDTPEELAQLGQYLVNVIDFRDTDCTMTIWDNPDVYFVPVNADANAQPQLRFSNLDSSGNPIAGVGRLRHYGMEYNPVAINEVLAFSYTRKNGTTAGAGLPTGRFFIELVNTLSEPDGSPGRDNNASVVNLSGYNPAAGVAAHYAGACWDLVFTSDGVDSRPDPFTGQLQQGATVHGVTPLGVDALSTKEGAGAAAPVGEGALLRALPRGTGDPMPAAVFAFEHPDTAGLVGDHEHPAGAAAPAPSWSSLPAFSGGTPSGTLYSLKRTYDPFNTAAIPPGLDIPVGARPRNLDGTPVATFTPVPIPRAPDAGAYYWVHLRRPANPMRPVSADNPMVVVDSMRFPYVDVGGSGLTTATPSPSGDPLRVDNVTRAAESFRVYSYQRMQPYRGGQAVPWTPGAAGSIDPRYGFTEQIAAPISQLGDIRVFYGRDTTQRDDSGSATGELTRERIYNTLGQVNDGAAGEFWDWFPFHDRDFTSPYELTLVPACGPGLFTKQFAEFAPTAENAPGLRAAAAGSLITSSATINALPVDPGAEVANAYSAKPFLFRGATAPVEPHSHPYLVDKFFYTGANPPVASAPPLPTDDILYNATTTAGTVGGYAADGWFKMFEFLEVPSQSTGAIGMVQNGTNFDWARQDARPGLLNLNLIIDEEVFFGLLGKQDQAYNQELLDINQVPTPPAATRFEGGRWLPLGNPPPLVAGYAPIPMVVAATAADGSPTYVQPVDNIGYINGGFQNMKGAFAQFLWARHGGSGFLFGFGDGATAQNQTIEAAGRTQPYFGLPAERPFRSPSYPDVGFSPMRPATLPPSLYTDPPLNVAIPVNANPVADDPGVRNQRVFHGYERTVWGGNNPGAGSSNTATVFPPPIPTRRLFQPADARAGVSASNAGLFGNEFVNRIHPVNGAAGQNPTIGGLPGRGFGEGATNLFGVDAKLGLGGTSMTQHPYFRGEQMQRILNLTTVRTHQFAVWITIGFFEVKREGDISMIGSPYPSAAFDVLGPEIGASTGQNARHRSFFVVDRLKLTGFDPDAVGAFRPAVVYRRTIQ
ncbi:hypothetical protein [Paludisphaera sp.]|uniref:hypothetical protein n=1 Tax=Paludisphaera sp. TaxID=2017432 RepID=UPI00301CC9B7